MTITFCNKLVLSDSVIKLTYIRPISSPEMYLKCMHCYYFDKKVETTTMHLG